MRWMICDEWYAMNDMRLMIRDQWYIGAWYAMNDMRWMICDEWYAGEWYAMNDMRWMICDEWYAMSDMLVNETRWMICDEWYAGEWEELTYTPGRVEFQSVSPRTWDTFALNAQEVRFNIPPNFFWLKRGLAGQSLLHPRSPGQLLMCSSFYSGSRISKPQQQQLQAAVVRIISSICFFFKSLQARQLWNWMLRGRSRSNRCDRPLQPF